MMNITSKTYYGIWWIPHIPEAKIKDTRHYLLRLDELSKKNCLTAIDISKINETLT
jgi:hypothetical protein